MKFLIVNDLHLGLQRKAGATPASMAAYQEMQFHILKAAITNHHSEDTTLIVLGDLFAGPRVDYALLWKLAQTLNSWLAPILLVAGNHDINKDREQMSALQFLARMLPQALLVEKPAAFSDGGRIAVIPHVPNQEAFDSAVTEAAETAEVLLAHCNFDNPFCEGQDHSLNLTLEQSAQFELVILGHEHVKRTVNNTHVLGSPWPCNIQEAEVDHFIHLWDGESAPQPVDTWSSDDYGAQDWRDLRDSASFIRVVGTAEATEAATLIQQVSKFRATSTALMISNSVKLGDFQMEELEDSLESLETFDPLATLYSLLPEKFQLRLKELFNQCN